MRKDGEMIDHVEDSNWDRIKDKLKTQKVPVLMIEWSDQVRGVQASQIQDISGDYSV